MRRPQLRTVHDLISSPRAFAGRAAPKEGYSITPDPYYCERAWETRGKLRGTKAVWHARIISYMAGAEAETMCLGLQAVGDGDDRLQVERMLEELNPPHWERCEARLRAMTRILVRRHRQRIERVARALLAKRSLSTQELDTLIGRSVADFKVNSPALLFLHARHGFEDAHGASR